MKNNLVGNYISIMRQKRKPKITQNDLAARLQALGWNISRSGIAKIETGVRQVSDIEVVLLAKALKVSPVFLLENALKTNISGDFFDEG